MTVTLERPSTKTEYYVEPTLDELEQRLQNIRDVAPAVTFESNGIENGVRSLIVHTEGVIGSFKARGAYMKVKGAYDKGFREFSGASAGNHSQGIALSVSILPGAHATLFMPADTPQVKIDATVHRGGDSVEVDTLSPDLKTAIARSRESGAFDVPPYDDYDIIAGQETVAYETLLAHPEADKLFVPCGGGGLLAGTLEVVATLKAAGLINSRLKAVAVIYEGNDSLLTTLERGYVQPARDVSTFCEGSAVTQIGEKPAEIILQNREHLEVVVVTKEDLGRAAYQFEEQGDERYDRPETTGLFAEAGCLKLQKQHFSSGPRETWLSLRSGTNCDPAKWEVAKAAYDEALDREDRAARSNQVGRTIAGLFVTRPKIQQFKSGL